MTNEVQNAMWGMYEGLNAQRDDATRRRAGQAIAGGDYGAGAQALLSGGMLQDGLAVQGAGQDMDRQEQADQLEFMREAARMLVGVRDRSQGDPNALAQAWQGLAPVFQRMPGADPAMIDQYWQAIQTNPAILDQITAALDDEVQRFNTRDGVVEVRGGRADLIYETAPQSPDAPVGYRWTADGSLEIIPGGPADPAIIARRSAAGRAPPRHRASGGGGSSSGGGSRPQTPPARPSGSGGLPPGFTPRRRGS